MNSQFKNLSNRSKGFSTVELLVTLFVASAFLLAGFQLYTMVIKDGGETKAQAKANNKAYSYLQKWKINQTYIQPSCTPYTVRDGDPANSGYENLHPTVPGLSNVSVEINITCPTQFGAFSAIYDSSLGYYYALERSVYYDWQDESPIPGKVNKDSFNVWWNGIISVPEDGTYNFRIKYSGTIVINVDGSPLYSGGLATNKTEVRSKLLLKGNYQFDINYYKYDAGNSLIFLEYKKSSDTNYKILAPDSNYNSENFTPSISKVEVILTYGNNKQVVQATYVNKE